MDPFENGINYGGQFVLPLAELEFSAIRAQGAGGQNVNKVSSAIHLRFDITNSISLPDFIQQRLLALSDSRISKAGVLVIKAQEFRTQEKNRMAACERLQDLLNTIAQRKKKRIATKPSRAAKERRLQGKTKRSVVKSNRGRVSW